jgi:hypothetical protein
VIAIAVIVVALASLVSFADDVSSLRDARRGEYAADAVALAASQPGWSSTVRTALERAWDIRINEVVTDTGATIGADAIDTHGARVDVTVRTASGSYTASAVARTLDVTPGESSDNPVTTP